MAFLSVKNLSLKTASGAVYSDVSFSCEKGSVVAIYGSEKSGRTSFLLSVAGRMKPSSGDIDFGPYSLSKKHGKIRHDCALSFFSDLNAVQSFLKVDKILSAELQLSGKRSNKKAVREYLERWDFSKLAKTRYIDLDSYNKAIFGFMLAASGDPSLICVDDIESNLTQHQSSKLIKLFKDYAKQTGCIVLSVVSAYEIASYADGVVVMSQEAESQRQAVLKQFPDYYVSVLGSGNGVKPAPTAQSANKQDKNTKGLK